MPALAFRVTFRIAISPGQFYDLSMSAQVELVLRNPLKLDERVSVFLEPYGTPLAARWIESLRGTLRASHTLEKDLSFMGFLGTHRDKNFLASRIQSAVEEIRAYRGEGPWKVGYAIPENCDPDTLDQPSLNRFHFHYETLMGQLWNYSPYFIHGDKKVRLAIRELNLLVHETEMLERSKNHMAKRGKIWPSSLISLLHDGEFRKPLHDEDYELFTLDTNYFGAVNIRYCQTGKHHFDAWMDGDKDIRGNNVNGLRYYSADFELRWGPSSDDSDRAFLERTRFEPFRQWLKEKGYEFKSPSYFVDEEGVRQGLGYLPVGRMPERQFGGRSVREIQEWVARHSDVYQIRLHEDGSVTEATYEYLFGNPSFDELLLERLDF